MLITFKYPQYKLFKVYKYLSAWEPRLAVDWGKKMQFRNKSLDKLLMSASFHLFVLAAIRSETDFDFLKDFRLQIASFASYSVRIPKTFSNWGLIVVWIWVWQFHQLSTLSNRNYSVCDYKWKRNLRSTNHWTRSLLGADLSDTFLFRAFWSAFHACLCLRNMSWDRWLLVWALWF